MQTDLEIGKGRMRIWVTKYALTKGIKVYDNATIDEDNPQHVTAPSNEWGALNREVSYRGEGSNWHRSEGSALERAEDMRQSKIKALKKQAAKLEKMTIPTVYVKYEPDE
jgi:hypothetical protein